MLDDSVMNAVTAFYGGAAELSRQITHSAASKAILVIPPQNISDSSAVALQELLQETAQLFLTETADNLQKRRALLISALMPSVPPGALKQAGMEARARTAVLTQSEWLSAKDIVDKAGLSAANASSTPWKWKQDGSIFAINTDNKFLYPGYGFDPDNGYRPLKSLKAILDLFKGHKEGWSLAYWFASVNSFLGGQRPLDLLKNAPDRVLAAAKDEVAGVAHG